MFNERYQFTLVRTYADGQTERVTVDTESTEDSVDITSKQLAVAYNRFMSACGFTHGFEYASEE